MNEIHTNVLDGNRRRFLAFSGMAAMVAAVPAIAAPQAGSFIDQTILWLRDRFMQEAQRFVSGNSINVSAERLGRLAHIMAELPSAGDRAIAAKRDVAEWEGNIGEEIVSYDVMTKLALLASIRRDERGSKC